MPRPAAQSGRARSAFRSVQNWRANVEFVARVPSAPTTSPIPGCCRSARTGRRSAPTPCAPTRCSWSALDGLGLDEVEMDMSVTMVANYIYGAVRDVARSRMVKEQTGMSDDEWWYKIAPLPRNARLFALSGGEPRRPDRGRALWAGRPGAGLRFRPSRAARRAGTADRQQGQALTAGSQAPNSGK